MKKLNKKGFTLIELLAVIVILAVILVIAVPSVIGVIRDSKTKSIQSSAALVARYAKQAILVDSLKGAAETKSFTYESDGSIATDCIGTFTGFTSGLSTNEYVLTGTPPACSTLSFNAATQKVVVTLVGTGSLAGFDATVTGD